MIEAGMALIGQLSANATRQMDPTDPWTKVFAIVMMIFWTVFVIYVSYDLWKRRND